MKTKDWVKTKVKKGQKESERGKKWKRIIKGQKGRTKGLKSQKWQKKNLKIVEKRFLNSTLNLVEFARVKMDSMGQIVMIEAQ